MHQPSASPGVSIAEATRLAGHKWRHDREERQAKHGIAICPNCKRSMPAFRAKCTRRNCPGYADLYAGDHRVRLFAALKSYDSSEWPCDVKPQVWMSTITAPGVAPRSESQAVALKDLGLRGLDSPTAIKVWNANAGRQWGELHRAAQQAVKRKCGKRARLLGYGWQQQDRGALHNHVILGFAVPWEKQAAQLYVRELNRLAPRYGFGFVDRKRDVKEATAAAAYLSSYFCEGKGNKITLRESAVSGELPSMPIYVAQELLRLSGVTMRSLRLVRFFWVRKGQGYVQLVRVLEEEGELRFTTLYAAWVMGGDDFASCVLRWAMDRRAAARAGPAFRWAGP